MCCSIIATFNFNIMLPMLYILLDKVPYNEVLRAILLSASVAAAPC